MAMITAIRAALAKLGYKVHATRQEKIGSNELVVVLDDVEVEIETTLTYHTRNYVLIEWDTSTPDNIPTQIVTLIAALEEYMLYNTTESLRSSFTFIQSEINPLGITYRVSIIIRYTEVINLGSN